MEVTQDEVPKESPDNASPESNIEGKSPTPQPQDPPRKSKKEDRSKKDDKNVEQFMRSLNSVPSVDEKLSLVCKKYVQATDDIKKLQFYIKQSDKRYTLLSKEKEQLQHEYNKTILVKSKLENLCRELQKQNKAIKEESLLKIREEEERRKETQAKFQNTLSEITTLLQQNNEKNAKLRDDNISMTEKFKSVVQQYQLREQQVDKMAKQMTLESQLSDAKLQKASLEHQAERERIMAEMEHLKVTLAQYRAKIMELQGTETALKGQLAVYTDKYDEFQNALVKSNQVFGGFKEQMEKMSKKIQKLEKESLSWKKRWETSQTALLDMCGERQASEERAAASGRHLLQMQSLCRTLQAERAALLGTLKEHNIERPPLPAPPPAPLPPAPASDAKVDAMAANCAQLRQSLAHLQSQLNVLTNKKDKEESPKPEKPKKSKSKKNKSEKQAQKASQEVSQEVSDAKEAESESSKGTPQESPNEEETKDQNDDSSKEDKIDSKTMESLIQAINMANINICDLEVVSEDIVKQNSEIEEAKAVLIEEIVDKPNIEPNDKDISSDIEASAMEISNESKVPITDKDLTSNEAESKSTDLTNEVVSSVGSEKALITSNVVLNDEAPPTISNNVEPPITSNEVASNVVELPTASKEVVSNVELPTASKEVVSNVELPTASKEVVSKVELPTASKEVVSKVELPTASKEVVSNVELPTASKEVVSNVELPTASKEVVSNVELPTASKEVVSNVEVPTASKEVVSKVELPTASKEVVSNVELPTASKKVVSNVELPISSKEVASNVELPITLKEVSTIEPKSPVKVQPKHAAKKNKGSKKAESKAALVPDVKPSNEPLIEKVTEEKPVSTET